MCRCWGHLFVWVDHKKLCRDFSTRFSGAKQLAVSGSPSFYVALGAVGVSI
jgi:hypothetical protein